MLSILVFLVHFPITCNKLGMTDWNVNENVMINDIILVDINNRKCGVKKGIPMISSSRCAGIYRVNKSQYFVRECTHESSSYIEYSVPRGYKLCTITTSYVITTLIDNSTIWLLMMSTAI